jgi:hypothetical protein
MISRKMLAVVGPLAIVAIVAGGAIAVATNSPSETPAVTTSGSATRTPDGGPSDVATSTDAVADDDGTADQGPGDVQADDEGDQDDESLGSDNSGPGNAEDNAGPSENSGPGSVDDDREQGDDDSGEGE